MSDPLKASPRELNDVSSPLAIPVEVEIFINPDGSVTFADLEERMISLVQVLNPDHSLACNVPALLEQQPEIVDRDGEI